MFFLRAPQRRLACLVLTAIVAPIAVAADGEMVVVDQKELSAYWRADQAGTQSIELTSDGPEFYGCMAVPFVIDPEGRVSPGREPLLARVGQTGASGTPDVGALYIYVMGALPGFTATWDKTLSDTIYSSRSLVFGDARIRQRLGDERWAALRMNLEGQCQINGLAEWVSKNSTVVIQTLPPRPEDLLAPPK